VIVLQQTLIQLVLKSFGSPCGPLTARLRVRISETIDAAKFLSIGERIALNIESTLEQFGTPVQSVPAVLDFGCGCGRTLKWLLKRHPENRLPAVMSMMNLLDDAGRTYLPPPSRSTILCPLCRSQIHLSILSTPFLFSLTWVRNIWRAGSRNYAVC
jgi:hypothetical protein